MTSTTPIYVPANSFFPTDDSYHLALTNSDTTPYLSKENFILALSKLEKQYRDLGVRYHCLPLAIQKDMTLERAMLCRSEFCAQQDLFLSPQMVNHLSRLRDIKRFHCERGGDPTPESIAPLRLAMSNLAILEDEVQELEDAQFEVCHTGIYRDQGLPTSTTSDREKYVRMKAWALRVPEVQYAITHLGDCEDEAVAAFMNLDEIYDVPKVSGRKSARIVEGEETANGAVHEEVQFRPGELVTVETTGMTVELERFDEESQGRFQWETFCDAGRVDVWTRFPDGED